MTVALRLARVFGLRERVERVVRSRRFVWVAGPSSPGGASVGPGFRVPPWDIASAVRSAARRRAEDVLESVRSAEFPDRPSRDGCRFVFPDIFAARAWARGRSPVFQVEVTGTVFYTDLELYTELVEASVGLATPDRARSEALTRDYWRGVSHEPRGGRGSTVECLVDGTVTVVREVDADRLTAMGQPPPRPPRQVS